MKHNDLQDGRFARLCAHRGLSGVCPENTLPAFGAALAVGADEIEFDLWLSRDGVAVVCHDETVDRTCVGSGRLSELEWPVIRNFDAGAKHSPMWRGVRMPRLEEVLDLTSGRIGLNIHIKEPGAGGELVSLVCAMIRKRGLEGVAYIAGDEAVLRTAMDSAPEVPRACLHATEHPHEQLRIARKYGCRRVQFERHHVTPDDICRAHDANLTCNLFWSDDAKDATGYVHSGIDVILTNCAHQLIADGVRAIDDIRIKT